MRRIIVLLIFSGISLLGFSQKTITGKVTSASDEMPLPGVNVTIKGTSDGTVTDLNGDYSITVNEGQTLIFSYIGYLSEEVVIESQTAIDILMIEDVTKLDEVVLVGYGTMKRSDLTTASVTVSGETLQQSVSSGLDQALQGRAAGVVVTQTSGQPGSSVSVRIRGNNTINAAAEPLYVIDGVPVSTAGSSSYDYGLAGASGGNKTTFNPLSGLNPSDIESIEVLKDASAASIYGSRASNGVVLITTKRGSKDKSNINYTGYTGYQEMPVLLDVMNLREFAEYSNDLAAETDGRTPKAEFEDPSLLGEGTNWQEAMFRRAAITNHQLTVSGGSEKTQYAFSAGYFDQQGVIVGSEFKRYSTRLNLDTDVKKWFKIGTSLSLNSTHDRIGLADQTGGIITTALKQTPDIPVYNFDGTYAGAVEEGTGGRMNPIAKAMEEEHVLGRIHLLGNIYGEISFTPNLKFRTEFGGNFNSTSASSFLPTYAYGTLVKEMNDISKTRQQNVFWQIKNILSYNYNIGENHHLSGIIAHEATEWTYENLSAQRSDLPVNDLHQISLGDPETAANSDSKGSGAMESAFGRVHYNLMNKYNLSATLRYDGSSSFGPNNRWAMFPSISGSWRISEESFMVNAKSIVDNMKLRLSWGQSGNSSIGGYSYGTVLVSLPTNLGNGFRPGNHANPDLTWEATNEVNIGMDAGFFNSRIELVVDLYKRTTKDMLMPAQLAAYMGTEGNPAFNLTPPWYNLGSIENKGYEIMLITHNLKGDFQWNTTLTFAQNKNKMVDLGFDGFLRGNAQWDDEISRSENGLPLYQFYGYKVDRIFTDMEDILNSPVQYSIDDNGDPYFSRETTVWPGDIKFVDIDGNDTIDINDRTYLGNPIPKFSFGLNNTMSYKGFELTVFLMGSYGNKIFNYLGRGLDNMQGQWDNQLKTVTERAKLVPIDATIGEGDEEYVYWDDVTNVQVSNPNTMMPRAIWSDPNQNSRMSDRYVEDGSFIRIKNLSLAYNLPTSLISKAAMANLKIFMNIQNLYTFTKYSGYDPEIGEDTLNDNVYGLDNGRYPSPRMYTFGVNVTF